MAKLRVIVGQGTAAEVFRSTAPVVDGYENVIIGPAGLWTALPQRHRMGQTPELLHLPGQPVPPHTVASGRTAGGMAQFLDVRTYQTALMDLLEVNDAARATRRESGGISLSNLRVTQITERAAGGQMLVATSHPGITFLADQVILASGIGPQRAIPPEVFQGAPDPSLPYPQIMEGVQYLNYNGPHGRRTAVYGGSATSAWVAEKALGKSDRLIWFTRPGGSEFTGCTLPGDRNQRVLEATRDMRKLAKLIKVEYRPALSPDQGRPKPRLRAMLRLTLESAGGAREFCMVDQLIHSIGGDPLGEGSMQNLLDDDIKRALIPILDIDRVISSNGEGVLAIGTPSRNVLIIGAGTYNYGRLGVSARSAPMSTLPTASQVPDGIAMIVASESALNNFIPFEQDATGQVTSANLNVNLADRNQLAIYLALFYPDLTTAQSRIIVERVISLRSSGAGHEFGISEAELVGIINAAMNRPTAAQLPPRVG